MKYRKLDSKGDFTLGTGTDFYQNVPAAVGQAVQTRLRLFTSEWFLDSTEGTPWRTDVLGKYTAQSYDSVIKARILGTQGVRQIRDYSSSVDPVKRSLSVAATIDTIYGSTSLNVTL